MDHIPVMCKEVLDALSLHEGAKVLDATVGLGGHAEKILEAIGPNGHLTAFDRDEQNLLEAKKRLTRFDGQITFIHDSFGNIAHHDLPAMDALLFDLGFSSVHVDDPSRGFSFQTDGPLDMRYNIHDEVSAETIIATYSEDQLAEIFRLYGEEKLARPIAQAICKTRAKTPIKSTLQLADLITSIKPRRGRIHPATQVFQALRMAVNNELGEIEKGLGAGTEILTSGGRAAIITFHSLEDRLVKNYFKNPIFVNNELVKPSQEEIEANPRSRSAKLRIALKK
ncbi:MAG: 16S rRNA (cytosine(1402)-N(4))-methyltransferase RsmH [Patescibacteria group bacterium]